MRRFIKNCSLHTIHFMSLCILMLLTTTSLVCSCHIDQNEHVYYTFLSAWNILLLLGILFLLYFIYKRRSSLPVPSITVLLPLSFLIGILFVLATRFAPKADQYVCFTIAKQMHAKDFSSFAPNAYMQIYPQQTGIVLFYYYLGFLVGTTNTLAVQLLNVIWYVCFLYYTYQIAIRLTGHRRLACGSVCLALLFLPLLFYTSFIYGTMPGLAFSSFAILKAMDYMEDGHRFHNAFLCSICCAIAVLFKKNYLIVMIAILLTWALHHLLEARRRQLLLLLLPLIMTLLLTKGSTLLCEQITGLPLGEGMPTIAWVTMGLQNSYRANGWYNSYSLRTFQEQNGDTDKTAKVARQELLKRIHTFSANKSFAARFFLSKISSEWNDSTFQGLIINNTSMVTAKNSPFISSIQSHCGHPVLLGYLDIFLKLTYLGSLLYVVLEHRHMTIELLIPLTAFLGGFLFHSIWEAKSQYTITYFILLFPYCLCGYHRWFSELENWSTRKVQKRLVLVPALYLAVTFLCYGILAYNPIVLSNILRSNNEYECFLLQSPFEAPELHGNYRLKVPNSSEFMTFTNKIFLTQNKSVHQILHIVQNSSSTSIQLLKQKKPLNIYHLPMTGRPPSRYRDIYQLSHAVNWKLCAFPDHSYILSNTRNYALTRTSDKRIILTPYDTQNPNQRWILEGA